MKQVIMTREKILKSKEYLIDPNDPDTEGKEIWSNEDCEPFWNEYYRVGVFDPDKYEDETEALNANSDCFYSFAEAYEYYKDLNIELGKEEYGHLHKSENDKRP